MILFASKLFQFVQFVVLAVVAVNELYPELHLAGRIRKWLDMVALGPQPEPPDVQ